MSELSLPTEVESNIWQNQVGLYILTSVLALLIYDQGKVRKALSKVVANFHQ